MPLFSHNRPVREIFRRVRLQVEELERRDVPSSVVHNATIDAGSFATDHILVRWLNDSPPPTVLSTGTSALGNDTYDVNLAAGVTVDQAIAYYSKLGNVDFAQRDYIVTTAMVPNDTYISSQWALSAISAQTAWNYTTGGARILVAVVDTGADYTDTDLAPNLVAGHNYVNNTTNTMDDNGHGSHVSGIIGAVGNNGVGVAGVDWNVEIMPLKFMDANGSGYLSNAVLAVNYAVQMGAKIINNSWGGGGYDAAMASAIQNAQAHGVIFVAAAGNYGSNNDTTAEYPASYAYGNVVSVAATDQNNNLASFSDYGAKTVSIAAPGVSILSTTPHNTYSYYSGTSMAAPFVTGALALVWSAHPSWSYTQVIADVLNNTDHLASLNGKVATGLLDIGKAIAAAQPAPVAKPVVTAPVPIPVPTPTPPAAPTTQPSSGGTSFGSGNVSLAFSGQQSVTSNFTISQHMSIGTLTATVNIQNSIDANLQVTLIAPTGQQILLFNRRGGDGSNLTGTTFADASPNAIYRGQAPFSGTVRPEYALSAFKNLDAFGTWKLVVNSTTSANAGKVLNWSLNITAPPSTTKSASIGTSESVELGAVGWNSSPITPAASGPLTQNSDIANAVAPSGPVDTAHASNHASLSNFKVSPMAGGEADGDEELERLIAALFVRV